MVTNYLEQQHNTTEEHQQLLSGAKAARNKVTRDEPVTKGTRSREEAYFFEHKGPKKEKGKGGKRGRYGDRSLSLALRGKPSAGAKSSPKNWNGSFWQVGPATLFQTLNW